MAVISAPADWVESVSRLRLPAKADRADLESLVELSERLSLVRAEALHLLGRKPE